MLKVFKKLNYYYLYLVDINVIIKSGDMRNLKDERLGLVETTILEFAKKGNSSIEELREYLISKYQLTVSNTVLRKRIEGLMFK